jgi:plasmid stability protein
MLCSKPATVNHRNPNAISDIIDCMTSITIRGLEDTVKKRLRVRAARHGWSMEEEAREILKAGVANGAQERNLAESIRALLDPLGGVELPAYPRRKEPVREPPRFD